MNIYNVRPFYGIDCDSKHGLNGGADLDEIEVHAESEETAIERARDVFILTQGLDPRSVDKSKPGRIEQTISYHRADGTEISEQEFVDNFKDGDFYKFEYVDFTKIVRRG